MQKIPKVSFIYAYPLDIGRRKLAEENGIEDYPTPEGIQEIMRRWESLWAEHNADDQIVRLISKVTKRTPTRSLECFVIGGVLNPMSAPFIMPVRNWKGEIRSDDNFVLTMIHELLHIFLSTSNKKYWTHIRRRYLDESPVTINHIILYALLSEIYERLYKKQIPEFIRTDLPPDYARAIHIVKDVGVCAIIEEYNSFAE